MGVWSKAKVIFSGTARASLAVPELTSPSAELAEPAHLPAVTPVSLRGDLRGLPRRPPEARSYEAEKAKAAAVGQSVKSYRAGYVPPAEAKSELVADPDGMPPLRLVRSNNGLDLALPDGQLVDYKILALRHFQIFAFRVVGMGFHEDPNKPFNFRNGQRVQVVRETNNEHDANAVAITTGRAAKKIGYVNKQRAAWVAKLLDAGQELDGIIIQSKAASPRVLLTTPEMLAYLQRD
ncbi:HIRAN domain-containing protein [Arthrobacter sp. NPDC056886]|uniref:HIRAN domain-containing protein n=1 Tax=Arthrobacter sp. NPDC056886 TaxID=3345960 RepID=UPI003671B9C6